MLQEGVSHRRAQTEPAGPERRSTFAPRRSCRPRRLCVTLSTGLAPGGGPAWHGDSGQVPSPSKPVTSPRKRGGWAGSAEPCPALTVGTSVVLIASLGHEGMPFWSLSPRLLPCGLPTERCLPGNQSSCSLLRGSLGVWRALLVSICARALWLAPGLQGPPQGPPGAGSLSSLPPWPAERASGPAEIRVPFRTLRLAHGLGGGRFASPRWALRLRVRGRGRRRTGLRAGERGSPPRTVPEEMHPQRFNICP